MLSSFLALTNVLANNNKFGQFGVDEERRLHPFENESAARRGEHALHNENPVQPGEHGEPLHLLRIPQSSSYLISSATNMCYRCYSARMCALLLRTDLGLRPPTGAVLRTFRARISTRCAGFRARPTGRSCAFLPVDGEAIRLVLVCAWLVAG